MELHNTLHPISHFLVSTRNEDFPRLQYDVSQLSIDTVEALSAALLKLCKPFEGKENIVEKKRLAYFQTQLTNLIENNPMIAPNTRFLDALCALIQLIKNTSCNTFFSFIQEELSHHHNHQALSAYAVLERLLYPNLHGDHQLFLQAAKENDIPIRVFTPPHLSDGDEMLGKLQNSPNANFLGALTAYGVGFAPSVMGNLVAARLLSVSPFYRLLISIAPTALGGLARLIVADQSIRGSGKESVMFFLGGSTLGLISVFALIAMVKLEDIKVHSLPYAILLGSNVISGLGISAFSAISLSLQSTPDESYALYVERSQTLVGAKPTYLDPILANMARAPSKQATSAIAGLGNLTPPLTLFLAAAVIPYINLNGYYGLISALTVLGITASARLVQNSYLDQLRQQNLPEDKARYLAYHLGQRSFLSGDLNGSFLKKFDNLKANEKLEVVRGVFNYIVSFGLLLAVGATGNLTIAQRGVPSGVVSVYTGSLIMVSSLVRAYYSVNYLKDSPLVSTNIAFIGMAITSALFASYDLEPGAIFAVWMLFAIFNGMANRSIFDELAHNIHHRMSETVTLAGGFGAWSAFTTSLLFTFAASTNRANGEVKNEVEQSNTSNEYLVATALSCLSLLLNSVYYFVLKPAIKDDTYEHMENSSTSVFNNHGLTLFSQHANAEYMALEKHKLLSPTVYRTVELDEELDDEEQELEEWENGAGIQII